MARVVVIGDLMTDAVAHARLPLARGSDTPASVTMHGGGSGANIAAWMAADGGDVAFVGRRGADIAGRNRDMELMGYGVDARLVMDPERPTGTCVVMVTHKGERTMLSDPGANAALSPDDLPHDLFIPGAHVHVSGYTLLSEGSRSAGLAAAATAAVEPSRCWQVATNSTAPPSSPPGSVQRPTEPWLTCLPLRSSVPATSWAAGLGSGPCTASPTSVGTKTSPGATLTSGATNSRTADRFIAPSPELNRPRCRPPMIQPTTAPRCRQQVHSPVSISFRPAQSQGSARTSERKMLIKSI